MTLILPFRSARLRRSILRPPPPLNQQGNHHTAFTIFFRKSPSLYKMLPGMAMSLQPSILVAPRPLREMYVRTNEKSQKSSTCSLCLRYRLIVEIHRSAYSLPRKNSVGSAFIFRGYLTPPQLSSPSIIHAALSPFYILLLLHVFYFTLASYY